MIEVLLKNRGKLANLVLTLSSTSRHVVLNVAKFFSVFLSNYSCSAAIECFKGNFPRICFCYYWFSCTVPLFTLLHFNAREVSVSDIAPSQFTELSLFPTTLNNLFGETGSNFLTGTKMVKAAHCLEHIAAMKTKTINTEAVNFFLCACCIQALGFAI